MADSQPVGDLAAAVSDALRGDRTGLNAITAAARQRAADRALDALMPTKPAPPAADPGPAPVPRRVPQPAPDRDVEIVLSNGRRVRASIAPAVARRRDLAAVARVSAENDRRAFDALRRQRRALARVSQAQEELSKNLTDLQAQSDRAFVGLAHGFADLQRRTRNAAGQAQGAIVVGGSPAAPGATGGGTRPPRPLRPIPPRRQLLAKQAQATKLLATRAQIQNVTNVVNTLQATAYGEKGRILAPNNLLLAGNQLFWTMLDPVLERLGVLNSSSATVMAALAPLGTLFTGQILVADRQMPRFISGVAQFNGTSTIVTESLRDRIGERRWAAFRERKDIVVTLTTINVSRPGVRLRAAVIDGSVYITVDALEGPPPKARVAWTVDTGADNG